MFGSVRHPARTYVPNAGVVASQDLAPSARSKSGLDLFPWRVMSGAQTRRLSHDAFRRLVDVTVATIVGLIFRRIEIPEGTTRISLAHPGLEPRFGFPRLVLEVARTGLHQPVRWRKFA